MTSEALRQTLIAAEEEVDVLRSMYDADFQDLREKDKWKVYRPPEVSLRLRPAQSMTDRKTFVSVTLRVKCTKDYPKQKPSIFLVEPKGIESEAIRQLKDTLERKALEMAQDEMVCVAELAELVRDFLYEHNERARGRRESIERKEADEERRRSLAEEKAANERKESEAKEIQLEIEKAKQKGSRQRLKDSVSEEEPRARSSTRRPDGTCQACLSLRPKRPQEALLWHQSEERRFELGSCLGHGSACGTAVLIAFSRDCPREMAAVTEWRFRLGRTCPEEQRQKLQEKLKHATSDIAGLYRLSHPNLVRYLAMAIGEDDPVLVQVATEFVGGPTLEAFLDGGVALPQLRHLASGALTGLNFLHTKNVPHRSLRLNSVFLDKSNVVRIADYGLYQRLHDAFCSMQHSVHFAGDSARPLPTSGRSSKKADVFALGRLILELFEGRKSDLELPQVSFSIPNPLRDFLSRCLCRSDPDRWSTEQLLAHPFIRDPLPQLFVAPSSSRPGVTTSSVTGQEEDDEEEEEEEEVEGTVPRTADASGESKLKRDFEAFEQLGKGGFGSVYKARNKLDGRSYAIKIVRLDPRKKALKRRITREVKVLSLLKHDHVVRYFFSWIETEVVPADSSESSTANTTAATSSVPPSDPSPTAAPTVATMAAPTPLSLNTFGMSQDFGSLKGRSAGFSEEWSDEEEAEEEDDEDEDEEVIDKTWHSFGPPLVAGTQDEEDEEDDEEEENGSGPSIVFGAGSAHTQSSSRAPGLPAAPAEAEADEEEEEEGGGGGVAKTQRLEYLFMLMEFCEKHTLRTAIDEGLHMDEARVMRMFREIVMGLGHIHEQGLIHRDLKPVNIFIDSSDHVKIGDFGLATSSSAIVREPSSSLVSASSSGDGSLTGRVGTTLYVSPEVLRAGRAGRFSYDQKVDLYSLGIIFFEMCYRPLTTNMERAKVLTRLRQESVEMPSDFGELCRTEQEKTIRQLLQHDPKERPTAKELLDSLPRTAMEQTKLEELLHSALEDRDSPAFQKVMGMLLKEQPSSAMDFTYDLDLRSMKVVAGYRPINAAPPAQLLQAYEDVTRVLKCIFKRHNAKKLRTPLLMPRSELYSHVTDRQCHVISPTGRVVSLPFDLRAPFARFVAKNEVTELRRFDMSRVFRESLLSAQPKEISQCAFDIVTPSRSLAADVEVLFVLHEVARELPCLTGRRPFSLRINHTDIVTGLFTHLGLPAEKHKEVAQLLTDSAAPRSQVPAEKMKERCQAKLKEVFSLTETNIALLFNVTEACGDRKLVGRRLRLITRTNTQGANLVKSGLAELEHIADLLTALDVPLFEITFTPGLVTSFHHCSGLLFSLLCSLPPARMGSAKRRRETASLQQEAIAMGGRYDSLVSHFQHPERRPSPSSEPRPGAVGFLMALERLAGLEESREGGRSAEPMEAKGPEVRVLCEGLARNGEGRAQEARALRFARRIWGDGLRCSMIFQTPASRSSRPVFVAQIDPTDEVTPVDLRQLGEQADYRRMTENEALEVLCAHWASRQRSSSIVESVVGQHGRSSSVEHGGGQNGTWRYRLALSEAKAPMKERRRLEARVENRLRALEALRGTADVILTDLNPSEICAMRQSLKTQASSEELAASQKVFLDSQHKPKKYFQKVFDTINELKFIEEKPMAILFGSDEFRILPFLEIKGSNN